MATILTGQQLDGRISFYNNLHGPQSQPCNHCRKGACVQAADVQTACTHAVCVLL